MSDITATFSNIITNTGQLLAYLRVPSGTTATPIGLTFFWPDGSYFNELLGDITNKIYFSFSPVPTQVDVFIFDLPTLQNMYSVTGTNYENYYGTDGLVAEFTKTVWDEGLYYYATNDASGDDIHWLLYIPTIETKLSELANQVLDNQCNCKLDPTISEKFIKAKAYQELINYKVTALPTDSILSTSQIKDRLSNINGMVDTLTNFLNGTDTICGC